MAELGWWWNDMAMMAAAELSWWWNDLVMMVASQGGGGSISF
jgi:hypothetical protein